MPIDKSPPWKAISWAEMYPGETGELNSAGMAYWVIQSHAGYTIASEWMTEEQARTIAAAPDLKAAAAKMLERHDAVAQLCHFTRCGCEDCAPFREPFAKAKALSP